MIDFEAEQIPSHAARLFPTVWIGSEREVKAKTAKEQRFNAGFRIGQVAPAHTRGGTACNYCVVIGAKEIAISGTPAPGTPSFRNTLSAGDRKTLGARVLVRVARQGPPTLDEGRRHRRSNY